MTELHFIRPHFLWGFLPLIAGLLVFIYNKQTAASWSQICDSHLLPHLLASTGKREYRLSALLLAVSGSLIVLALSGPSVSRVAQASYSQQQARVILLDVSDKMLAADIPPSRIKRAHYKIQDILSKTPDSQVGLVAFTREPFLVSPLTSDSETLALMLPELSPRIMPLDGANIGEALKMGAALIKQGGFQKGQLLLLTASHASDDDIAIAHKLNRAGLNISVLGLGTTLGAPATTREAGEILSRLDKKSLKQLSRAGGGSYATFTGSDKDINSLLAREKPFAAQLKKDKAVVYRWKDEGRYLLLLLLPFALLSFRRGSVF